MDALQQKYDIDQKTWDECAETYERQIVGGHPDILAYEDFEEDFLDRILRHLAKKDTRKIKLMDIGCGSGRLHIRYGAKTTGINDLPVSHPLVSIKHGDSKLAYDPILAGSLNEVWGIDFSENMIDLAEKKIIQTGLKHKQGTALTLEQGSAFEMKPESEKIIPVAICLVNSIGVMQGLDGAKALFDSMHKAVEAAKGIAIISCFQQEYIPSYGLGQYESTMDVSGQPVWMGPDTFATPEYKQVPRQYKLAHSNDDKLVVDVFDMKDRLVKEGHVLTRDPEKTRQTIDTGDINTYSDYASHWYSFAHIEQLIREYWDPDKTYHLKTRDLDIIRAEPAQLAILDFSGQLKDVLKLWNVH